VPLPLTVNARSTHKPDRAPTSGSGRPGDQGGRAPPQHGQADPRCARDRHRLEPWPNELPARCSRASATAGAGSRQVAARHRQQARPDAERVDGGQVLTRLAGRQPSSAATDDHHGGRWPEAGEHVADEALVTPARRRSRAPRPTGSGDHANPGRSSSRAGAPRPSGRAPCRSARAPASTCPWST
jgi:hypothetical protein